MSLSVQLLTSILLVPVEIIYNFILFIENRIKSETIENNNHLKSRAITIKLMFIANLLTYFCVQLK